MECIVYIYILCGSLNCILAVFGDDLVGDLVGTFFIMKEMRKDKHESHIFMASSIKIRTRKMYMDI